MSFWSFILDLFSKSNDNSEVTTITTTQDPIPVVPSELPAAPIPIPAPASVVTPKELLTASQLQEIMPRCPPNQLQVYTKAICIAMQEGQINTTQRIACFLGQIAHESNQLREWIENLNYSVKALMVTWPKRFPTVESAQPYANQPEKLANYVYANRMGNGDVASGDGFRFRGRSPLQLTGRNSYRSCGAYLGIDLENKPDLASGASIGFKISVWYWTSHNLNNLADIGDFVGITKAINGGTIGLAQREAFYKKALEVLQKG